MRSLSAYKLKNDGKSAELDAALLLENTVDILNTLDYYKIGEIHSKMQKSTTDKPFNFY